MADNNNNKRSSSSSRDIISRLSSELLCAIFCFLPFKEAARTSVLSTRFRHVWRGMKKIDFQENFFVQPNEPEDQKQIQRREFINFADQWLTNYTGTTVHTFSVTFSRPGDFLLDMHNFITFSLLYSVKGLTLDFHDPNWIREYGPENRIGVFDLPVHVYSHRVLESLKLFSCNIWVPGFRNFSALKQLSLGWIELKHNAVEALLLSCPLLESLSLKKCWSIDAQLYISRTNLRLTTLVVDKCNFLYGMVQIDAPNLRLFNYSGRAEQFYSETEFISLQEAEFDFGVEPEFFSEDGQYLYDLLEQLLSVRVLTVCSYLLQVVPCVDEPLGLLNTLNVRHLILKTAMNPFEYYGIRFMLKSCPLLETLTINIGRARIFQDYEPPFKLDREEFWTENLGVYRCIEASLKVVEVIGFKGSRNEVVFLKYLITLGCVLEELNLYLSKEVDGYGGNKEIYRQRGQWLHQFEKASPNLCISFY
ncbi:hypothetical protein ACOSP7_030472 [Xanthoceras sorbifolium]